MNTNNANLDFLNQQYRYWRVRIFISCWVMYASYYLCRQNISIAIPGIKAELGFTDMQIGWITSGLFVAYGIGQLLNGIIGDKLGARTLAPIGMIVSALSNIVFGLSYAFPVLLGLWIVNGYFQATGAPMRIKTLANWFPPKTRGKMMGFLGTDYVIGNVVCWILAGYLVEHYGWRSAFIVPGIIFIFSAVFFYLRVRNEPSDVGLPSIEQYERMNDSNDITNSSQIAQNSLDDEQIPLSYILKSSLGNHRVWIVGFAYFGVDLIRYGFMVWAPTYMFEHGAKISVAAYKNAMIPMVGAAGIIISGWLTDRIGGRRAPIISVMLFILAGLAYLYRIIPPTRWVLVLVVLGLIGFFLYGPHLLMGATIAMDLGSRKAAGAASGLIDGLGYAGAALSGVGTAYMKTHFGWNAAFWLWISGAIGAGILMLLLWNFKTKENQKYY